MYECFINGLLFDKPNYLLINTARENNNENILWKLNLDNGRLEEKIKNISLMSKNNRKAIVLDKLNNKLNILEAQKDGGQ